jgi:hypothetical protein
MQNVTNNKVQHGLLMENQHVVDAQLEKGLASL